MITNGRIIYKQNKQFMDENVKSLFQGQGQAAQKTLAKLVIFRILGLIWKNKLQYTEATYILN